MHLVLGLAARRAVVDLLRPGVGGGHADRLRARGKAADHQPHLVVHLLLRRQRQRRGPGRRLQPQHGQVGAVGQQVVQLAAALHLGQRPRAVHRRQVGAAGVALVAAQRLHQRHRPPLAVGVRALGQALRQQRLGAFTVDHGQPALTAAATGHLPAADHVQPRGVDDKAAAQRDHGHAAQRLHQGLQCGRVGVARGQRSQHAVAEQLVAQEGIGRRRDAHHAHRLRRLGQPGR
jgi:hypothetical protein